MDLDAIRNTAFLHNLYHKSAPFLRVLEVKNCTGLDSSREVPFFDALSPQHSPFPSPMPSPMPDGRTPVRGADGAHGTPFALRGKRSDRGTTSTPTFVVTPSKEHHQSTFSNRRERAPSSSSRALFSTPPSSVQCNQSLMIPVSGRPPSISAPTSPYATPPRQLVPMRSGSRSPYSSPLGSLTCGTRLQLLPHSFQLRELSLLKCAPPEHCVIQLVSALPNLEVLDLWGMYIAAHVRSISFSNLECQFPCAIFSHNTRAGCKITDKTVEILALHCTKIQKLSLAENPITNASMSLITPSSFPDLVSLTLRRCTDLSSVAIAGMVTAWHSGSPTARENSEGDYFEEQETHHSDLPLPITTPHIEDQHTNNQHGMETLDLWGILVYDHVLMALATSCPNLKSLWLGETAITDEGLIAASRCCTGLQEISLRRCSNGVTDAGIIPLLQANPSLRKIDLWVPMQARQLTVGHTRSFLCTQGSTESDRWDSPSYRAALCTKSSFSGIGRVGDQ